jgi:pilus assembly protein Flp/PilA
MYFVVIDYRRLVLMKNNLLNKISPPLPSKQKGATMVEYAIMIALVAVVAIAAIALLGTGVSTQFSNVGTSVSATG